MRLKILLILFALLIFASSCTNIQAPTSQFKKYEISRIGFSSASLIFYFDVENPNSIPIGIKDIDYKLALDESDVASGISEGFDLQAKEKKMVKFPIEISYSDLFGQAINVAKKFISRTGSIKYKIDGSLSIVDNIGISAKVPLEAQGEIELF